jgi:hypothetical protein
MPMRHVPRALPLLALLAAACGTHPSAGTPDDGCGGMLDTCFASQQGCAIDDKGAHCVPCAPGQYATQTGQCAGIAGKALQHDFAPFTANPGQEILGLCQSWTLDNATELWVTAVELNQDEASHHSNWTFVPDDKYAGPDGVWNCDDRKYSQLDAALSGGVLYAQSTQATHEVQHFPNGAAVRIPPWSRVIGDVHILNAGAQAVTGHAHLTVYTIDPADVRVKLVPFHLTYEGLDLPPMSASRFTGRCRLDNLFPTLSLDMKVYYILPHTHALATGFSVNVLGGPDDSKALIETHAYDSGPHGRAFDPPYDLSPAQGLSFYCQYLNPRADHVHWGYGDQEMCELLGFAQMNVAFESRVANATSEGSDGNVQLFSDQCTTLVFPWDFTRPGGPPR